jgi:hypothetical protein
LRVGSVLIAEIAFDLLAVGVVVRERGVHLGHIGSLIERRER